MALLAQRLYSVPMGNSDGWAIAKERASHYAPMPKHDPIQAGLASAFVAGMVVTVFLAFAGMRSEGFTTAIAGTMVVTFLGPYIYFKNQKRKHLDAAWRELKKDR